MVKMNNNQQRGNYNMTSNKTKKLLNYFNKMFKHTEIQCDHNYTGRIIDAKVCMLCGKTLEIEVNSEK
jgi:hypothetical protein